MELLTSKQVMDVLGIRRTAFVKLMSGTSGTPAPPCIRIGRRQLFRPAALEQWMKEMESRPQGTPQCSAVH